MIDFSKAFDSVLHSFIYKTLKHFNFGDHFINLDSKAISNATSYILCDTMNGIL